MGIRFYCPNGHKLNVKSHLAGKFGFCPECGIRMQIPLEDTRPSSKELRRQPEEQALAAPAAPQIQPAPTALPARSAEIPTVEAAAKKLSAEEPKPAANPYLEDGSLIWYIKDLAGPEYGPVEGRMVADWLCEKRISPAMLLWREDWPNWQEARIVFPELIEIFNER